MLYNGHVENGVVIFDDSVALPEGLKVKIEPVAAEGEEDKASDNGETLGQKLLKHAGKAVGLPCDLSDRNHDHYLYGTPKR